MTFSCSPNYALHDLWHLNNAVVDDSTFYYLRTAAETMKLWIQNFQDFRITEHNYLQNVKH